MSCPAVSGWSPCTARSAARLARIGLELSQDEIAARTPDLIRNFVSAIERGVQGLDAWRLRQLADALGVSPVWLLDLS